VQQGRRRLETHVGTLSMDIRKDTFKDTQAALVRPDANSFTSRGSIWCYRVGGTFVMCKGIVVGRRKFAGDQPSSGGEVTRVAQLPVGMRPMQLLRFAAVARSVRGVGGHITYGSRLVTLSVTPDGCILCEGNKDPECVVDLSAVRFCVGPGLSLVDEVTLHTVDVGGSRLVTLQGTTAERAFPIASKRPLAMLPENCRPPRDIVFITAGFAPGGFHLTQVRPCTSTPGCGGDISWLDCNWMRDRVNFTGVMYEVAPDAMDKTFQMLGNGCTKVLITDFQRCVVRCFGSIQSAWTHAFDTDGSGCINFTEFSLGCKVVGYLGNAMRLWAVLDEDRDGHISLSELYGDELGIERIVEDEPAPKVDREGFSKDQERRPQIMLQDFHRTLKRVYGSVWMAWQRLFDIDGNGSLSYGEFGMGCTKAGYDGNVPWLWAALDCDNSGLISFNELSGAHLGMKKIQIEDANVLLRSGTPTSARPASALPHTDNENERLHDRGTTR